MHQTGLERKRVTILSCTIAFFFAINIGASGAAASMGIAYGSNAVKTRENALFICAIGVLLGAILGGGEVVKTLGSAIIPEEIISINIALIILTSATISLFIANLLAIPLSTSEVTVGAIVGVGIAYKILFIKSLLLIVMYWLVIPIVAFFIAFYLNKIIKMTERRFTIIQKGKWPKILVFMAVTTGFIEAFSAGMNNVANAVGPIVAAGVFNLQIGILLGGICVAMGALLLGGRVLETNGKKITELSLLQGSAISGLGGTIVIIASLLGFQFHKHRFLHVAY